MSMKNIDKIKAELVQMGLIEGSLEGLKVTIESKEKRLSVLQVTFEDLKDEVVDYKKSFDKISV